MIDLSQARIKSVMLHHVGNKLKQEGKELGEKPLELDEDLEWNLANFFLSPFKKDEFFKFEGDLIENNVFGSADLFFQETNGIITTSTQIADWLYECGMFPHIKGGLLYVVHLTNCIIDEVTLEALGIFKSETRESFLEVTSKPDQSLSLKLSEGTLVNKLDRGCLVFNTFREDGYSLLCHNRDSFPKDWNDDFLSVKRIPDDNYLTTHFIEVFIDWTEECLAVEGDTIELKMALNRTHRYFSKKKEFDLDEFLASVVKPHLRLGFREYLESYCDDTSIDHGAIEAGFRISRSAYGKIKKRLKPVMKLDTSIQISASDKDFDSSSQYLERGFDKEKNMYFYKAYFNSDQV